MPKHFITGYSLIVDSSTEYHLIELVTLFERKSNVPVIGKVLVLDSSFKPLFIEVPNIFGYCASLALVENSFHLLLAYM